MSGEAVDFDEAKSRQKTEADGKRERSTISFPYNDVDDAVEIACAIHGNAGLSCEMDQLAGYMNQSLTSGAFRLQVSAARIFGLIEISKGKIELTTLGQQSVDPAQEAKAKADAFLNVPLYKAVFDKYRGGTLPPAKALEREMIALGVVAKQGEKARQVFERSADKAGYFGSGRNRLVPPAFKPLEATPPPVDEKNKGGGGGGADSPFIQGLLQKLPKPEAEWSIADRVKWLQTAAHIFGLMYSAKDQGEVEVKIKDETRSDDL